MSSWTAIIHLDKRWRAAVLLGAVTSTYSTVVASFGAEPLTGRSVAVDWMVVASALLGPTILSASPGFVITVVGMLVHQGADFGWAIAFFGVLGKWTQLLRPRLILVLALPSAAVTSTIEYFLILPVWQPLFVLEQPYWVGFAVHAASAFAYPLLPWLRDWIIFRQPPGGAAFGPRWACIMAGIALLLAAAFALQKLDRAPAWPLGDNEPIAYQRTFLEKMTVHHEVGIRLAALAVRKSTSPVPSEGTDITLQQLSELMVATQAGEARVMRSWLRSWYSHSHQQPVAHHGDMPGMIAPATLRHLEQLQAGPAFERAFIPTMIAHHAGAVTMAREAMVRVGDLRVILLADSIEHAQLGQINMLEDLSTQLERPAGWGVSNVQSARQR